MKLTDVEDWPHKPERVTFVRTSRFSPRTFAGLMFICAGLSWQVGLAESLGLLEAWDYTNYALVVIGAVMVSIKEHIELR